MLHEPSMGSALEGNIKSIGRGDCIFTSIPKILNLAKTHGQDMHSRVPHKPMANSQQPTKVLFLARHAN
jgi:hypothetical protein